MAFKISKSGRVVKASLPRKLPKEIIAAVDNGNEIASKFAKKASQIISKAKVAYEL